MATVYDFPRDWYDWFTKPYKYRLRSLNQVATKNWVGAISPKGPFAQLWMADCASRPLTETEVQDVDSFFARLRGRSGLVRFADASRLLPWHDRNLTPTISRFSDGTTFSDGTGFAEGYLPPTVRVGAAAARGDRFIVLKGFPASTDDILRRGDALEVWPNGVPAVFPHRYQVMYGGSSDADGQIGIAIEPGLRAAVAENDTVNLRYAASVFRLTSDDAGEMEIGGAGIGSVSFSLAEAVDQVP